MKRTGFVLRFNIDSTSISPVMKVECCLRERNRFGWNVQFPLFWIPQLGWTATPRLSNEFSFYPALDCLLQLTQIYWDIYLNYLWIGAWKAVSIKTLKVYIPTKSLTNVEGDWPIWAANLDPLGLLRRNSDIKEQQKVNGYQSWMRVGQSMFWAMFSC